jgi:hypothetical protein
MKPHKYDSRIVEEVENEDEQLEPLENLSNSF